MTQKAISFKREDHCICCHTDRIVELFDAYNKPINYAYYLDNQNKVGANVFDKRELSYFECKKCRTVYDISWENGIPEPWINKNILYIFMNNIYKKKID